MKPPIISIITPCYNIASKCQAFVESVRCLPSDGFEVIAVDDSSTDNTLSILKHLQEESRLPFTVIAGDYRGPGGGRNAGLDAAKGKYVWLVDADDRFHPEPIIRLLPEIAVSKQDILGFDVTEYAPPFRSTCKFHSSGLFARYRSFGRVAGKLISRRFLNKQSIRYLPVAYSSDNLFVLQICATYQETKHCAVDVYEVIPAPNSITRQSFNPKYLSRLDVIDKMVCLANTLESNRQAREMFRRLFVDLSLGRTYTYYLDRKEYFKLAKIFPYLIALNRDWDLLDDIREFLEKGSRRNRILKYSLFHTLGQLHWLIKDPRTHIRNLWQNCPR